MSNVSQSAPPAVDLLLQSRKVKAITRMIARYVRIDPSSRSVAGRYAINESRILNRGALDSIDFEKSRPEVMYDIAIAIIRRAVTAPPSRRTDVRASDGQVMWAVAPRRDLARVVHLKSRHEVASESSAEQDWRATVAMQLGKLRDAEEDALVMVAILRDERVRVRNVLEAARSDYERLRTGKSRAMRAKAERRVAFYARREKTLDTVIQRIERSGIYQGAIDLLWTVITGNPDTARYCFGQEAA